MKKFFHGKKVLITGDTGLLGSWLSLWLIKKNAIVFGYAMKPESSEGIHCKTDLLGKYEHTFADICDHALLKKTIDKIQPDIIYHLAAQALVSESYRNPGETIRVNILGTSTLLDVLRSVPRPIPVIVSTSDKCYEVTSRRTPFTEQDRLGGKDVYSMSKASQELLIKAYRESFFQDEFAPKIFSIRCGNIIGGGDFSKDRLVPDCIRSLMREQPIVLRNPTFVRPWQHVLEAVSAMTTATEKLSTLPSDTLPAWNIGPENDASIDVETFVKSFLKAWGSGSYQISTDQPSFAETAVLELASSKAQKELNWKPTWNIDCAIKNTVDWYAFAAKKNDTEAVFNFTSGQIDTFIQDMI